MKKYEAPSLEVTKLNLEDVIASGHSDFGVSEGDEGSTGTIGSWGSAVLSNFNL